MTRDEYTARTRFRCWLTSSWKSVADDRRPGQTRSVPDYTGDGTTGTPRQILAAYYDLRRVCGGGAFLGLRVVDKDGGPVSLDTLREIVSAQDARR